MKRTLKVIACLVLVTQLAGCATVQKKFTRKKKEPEYTPKALYFEEGKFQRRFSNDYYYKTHFTMWRTWHSELLDQLGGNSKKVSRCAEESLNHLTEMSHYLKPEKKALLDPIVADMGNLTHRIEQGAMTDAQTAPLRVELEKIQRLVNNDFYFDKIKDSLLPDTVDLGAPAGIK